MDTIFQMQEGNNKSTVLKKRLMQLLIMTDSASIADMAKELDISIPTVTKFVSELIDRQFLIDLGKQNTNGGRKPNIYGLNPKSGYFVGVDSSVRKFNLRQLTFVVKWFLNRWKCLITWKIPPRHWMRYL